jgi:4-nitrophenyl phosphatase
MDRFDTIILDCDGVLYQGDKALPHVPETIELLRAKGKKVYFLTNSSHRSRHETICKFEGFGFTAEISEVYTSSYIATQILPPDSHVFLVGSEGMYQTFIDQGVKVTKAPEHDSSNTNMLSEMEVDPTVTMVAVGMDPCFTMNKLAHVGIYLENPDVLFLATNVDVFDMIGGRRDPEAGSMVAAISALTGRKPDCIAGKPSPVMLELVMEENEAIDPARTVMFGDREDTDLLFA